MTDFTIPGMTRVKLSGHGRRKGSDARFYYVFNLEELTTEVALGHPGHERNSGTNQDFWSDTEIGLMLFDPGDVTQILEEHIEQAALAANDLIAGCSLNDEAIAHAREEDGFRSRMTDSDGADRGPTILFIPEEDLRAVRLASTQFHLGGTKIELGTSFASKYRELAAERTYKVALEDKDIAQHITDFGKFSLRSLREENEKLRKQCYPVHLALAQVQNAYLAVTAMIDFSRSPRERAKLWTTEPPKESEPLATSTGLLPDPPSGQQKANAEALRDNTLAPLVKHLSDTLSWMNSGNTELAKERDKSAKTVLTKLRNDEVIGTLLDDHEYVHPLLWMLLENLLVDAFQLIATSPAALEDLLQSELRAIAHKAARFEVVIDATSASNPREKALAERVVSFVADNEIVVNPSTLSQRLVGLFGDVDDAMSRTSTFARLLTAGLPAVLEDIERIDDARKISGRAWLFHAIVGVGNVEEDKQDALWRAINGIGTGNIGVKKSRLFSEKGGALSHSRRHLDSAAAWAGLKSMAAILTLREAVIEKDKAPAMHTIDVLKSVLEVSTASAEFVSTIAKSPTFMKAMAQHGEGLFKKMVSAGDHALLKGAGLFGAWLGFVTTAMTAKQAPTMTATQKEVQGEKVLFSGLQLALAAGSLVTGGLPLASLAMFVAQSLLTSRAKWAAKLLSDVEALPGTGRFVRGVWASITEDRDFAKAIKGSPRRSAVETLLGHLEQFTSEAHQSGRGAFWPLTKGELIAPDIARGILARQYGLDPGTTAKLASA